MEEGCAHGARFPVNAMPRCLCRSVGIGGHFYMYLYRGCKTRSSRSTAGTHMYSDEQSWRPRAAGGVGWRRRPFWAGTATARPRS